MIPRRREGQSFESHQREMAAWVGCTVDEMNAAHDTLHRELTAWLGTQSLALKQAAGEQLTAEEQALADFEEEAVLHVQRFMCRSRPEGEE